MGACLACGYLSRVPVDPTMRQDHLAVPPAMRQNLALVAREIRVEGRESGGMLACALGRPECAPDGACNDSTDYIPGLSPFEHVALRKGTVVRLDGAPGERGERGPQGYPGREGQMGPVGRDGKAGQDGRDLRWTWSSIAIVAAGEIGLLWVAKLLGAL